MADRPNILLITSDQQHFDTRRWHAQLAYDRFGDAADDTGLLLGRATRIHVHGYQWHLL